MTMQRFAVDGADTIWRELDGRWVADDDWFDTFNDLVQLRGPVRMFAEPARDESTCATSEPMPCEPQSRPGSSWQTSRPDPLSILAPPDRARSLAVEEIGPRARHATVWISDPKVHGGTAVVHLTPDQLDQVADDLRARAELIRANLR